MRELRYLVPLDRAQQNLGTTTLHVQDPENPDAAQSAAVATRPLSALKRRSRLRDFRGEVADDDDAGAEQAPTGLEPHLARQARPAPEAVDYRGIGTALGRPEQFLKGARRQSCTLPVGPLCASGKSCIPRDDITYFFRGFLLIIHSPMKHARCDRAAIPIKPIA